MSWFRVGCIVQPIKLKGNQTALSPHPPCVPDGQYCIIRTIQKEYARGYLIEKETLVEYKGIETKRWKSPQENSAEVV